MTMTKGRKGGREGGREGKKTSVQWTKIDLTAFQGQGTAIDYFI
jgi:hypothetical protein